MIARSLLLQMRPLLRVPVNRTFCQPFNLLSSRSDGRFDRPVPAKSTGQKDLSSRPRPAKSPGQNEPSSRRLFVENRSRSDGRLDRPRRAKSPGQNELSSRPRPAKSQGQNELSSRRLFVENLPPWCDWINLKDHARAATGFNVAYASISVDPDGHSKQCGLIEFESSARALDAIGMLDGTEMAEMAEDESPRRGSSSIAPPLRRPFVIRARMDRQQRERREGMSMGAIRLRLHFAASLIVSFCCSHSMPSS
jgi:hypothetical protein